ncbi:MAG: DUF2807 domain-containing protein [Sphingomonadaceae bacterium]|nr:DUF2807 domain-containing protein [Sphingomonadaceae bacterium]
MIGRMIAALAIAMLAVPASAERRGFSVTSFERMIVNGPFVVRVATGGGSSGYAEGDGAAIRQISVQVTGRTLTVRRNVSDNWGGYPGEGNDGSAILYLTTPSLNQVTVVGTSDVEIDRMRAGRVVASLGGNGRLAIASIDADDVTLGVTGAGVIEAGGHAETGRVTVQGAGMVSAEALLVENLRVNLSGPGTIDITADREAEIVASGNGNVMVRGDAACTDRSVGSGQIMCGGFSP